MRRHKKWCRKIPIHAPNSTSTILPVQKMPHFCTIFPRRQLLVQGNIVFCTGRVLGLSGGGELQCHVTCHFGRKIRLVDNLNGGGRKSVC